MRRIAFYGGTFDPPHIGHLAIAEKILKAFSLDEFVFIPAFHAPHKTRITPTSPYDRFAMLCLATSEMSGIKVSKMEIDIPERPYTVETLGRLKTLYPNDKMFFVMGADSWMDICSWREWEKVLLMTDHIVVTRPGSTISTDHVSDVVKERVIDARGLSDITTPSDAAHIYLTDAVNIDVSASAIRAVIRNGAPDWLAQVPTSVANYIEKYQIYS
jgi:nicotinate-nucleotide adenylyltransferase